MLIFFYFNDKIYILIYYFMYLYYKSFWNQADYYII